MVVWRRFSAASVSAPAELRPQKQVSACREPRCRPCTASGAVLQHGARRSACGKAGFRGKFCMWISHATRAFVCWGTPPCRSTWPRSRCRGAGSSGGSLLITGTRARREEVGSVRAGGGSANSTLLFPESCLMSAAPPLTFPTHPKSGDSRRSQLFTCTVAVVSSLGGRFPTSSHIKLRCDAVM